MSVALARCDSMRVGCTNPETLRDLSQQDARAAKRYRLGDFFFCESMLAAPRRSVAPRMAPLPGRVGMLDVARAGDGLKVAGPVVSLVAVLVVDLEPVRDWPLEIRPYDPMSHHAAGSPVDPKYKAQVTLSADRFGAARGARSNPVRPYGAVSPNRPLGVNRQHSRSYKFQRIFKCFAHNTAQQREGPIRSREMEVERWPSRPRFRIFGGKRDIAPDVWARLGRVRQYIEPFCGSAAVLLAAPAPASLEVVGDMNGFICNFWRATIHQPANVAQWADYPVSHIDLGARHVWMMDVGRRSALADSLRDPDWPGDPKLAGWWLWGQCCWIGSGWCEWGRQRGDGRTGDGQIPHVSNAGMGVQATGKIPHVSDAGRAYWTTGGLTADAWLHKLAARLERVRVIHGEWSRSLNHHYGGDDTAVFLDPPYEGYGALYGATSITAEVETWARENGRLRVALCGHRGDYDLPGWTVLEWERSRLTYAGDGTKADEAIWFSPACLNPSVQSSLFASAAPLFATEIA